MLKKIKDALSESYSNNTVRQLLMFQILNLLLFAVAATMSVINIVTKEYALFWITAVYTLFCLGNFLLSGKSIIIKYCFFVETVAMLSVFIITGVPDGFSILWILLIPACTLAIFGMKSGSVFSAVLLLDIIFFFWLPVGKSLLLYEYSETYMLRFPFVYVCMYLISLYVEWIRQKTMERLVEVESKNRWLYRHDALTGAFNRHAFYEELNQVLAKAAGKVVAVIMVDIDDFKNINDTYGHNLGDKVLCRVSEIILGSTCKHTLSCRWGGEEFLIVMSCDHDPMELAETIRRNVEESEILLENGDRMKFTVSEGIHLCKTSDRSQFLDHVNQADKAMYAAKSAGKNRIILTAGPHTGN